MELMEHDVYCDVHGCVHTKDTAPYDYGVLEGEEPECGPKDWRKLWIGGRVEKIARKGG